MIDALATLLETRDEALKKYRSAGASPVIKHTNKGGSTNFVKNPLLGVVMECNAQAMPYLRELGLTPAAAQQLGGGSQQEDTDNAIDELMQARAAKGRPGAVRKARNA